jgi:hypothetical protein
LVLRKNSSVLGAREEPSLLSNQAQRGISVHAAALPPQENTRVPRVARDDNSA